MSDLAVNKYDTPFKIDNSGLDHLTLIQDTDVVKNQHVGDFCSKKVNDFIDRAT